MKTILITGASGFLGKHLLKIIGKNFNNQFELVLLSSDKIDGYHCIAHRGYTYSKNDFIINGIDKIDIVIHLGGFSPRCFEDSDRCEENFSTIQNTQHLLNNLPNIPEAIILCSTITVYGDLSKSTNELDNMLINEETKPLPCNKYGLAKYCCELLVKEWANKHSINYHILRLTSLYGENDQRNQMINIMAKEAALGKNLTLTANPTIRRNIMYVDDCALFIYRLLIDQIESGIINIVSSYNPSFEQIVDAIVDASNNSIVCKKPNDYVTVSNILFDATKRETLLGFEEHNYVDGIKQLYEWYKNNTNKIKGD